MPRSNSSSLIDRSARVFSRSSAARVRSPSISGASRRSIPMSGSTVRSADAPIYAAANTAQLKRMIAAGDWPRERKTTTVAPMRPASVKSCQAWSDSCRSVEISELIVQAGVQRRVRDGAGAARCRHRTWSVMTRPASRIHDDHDETCAGQQIRQQPRQPVEPGVFGNIANELPVLHDEGREDRVVRLSFVNQLLDAFGLRAMSVTRWPHLTVGERGADTTRRSAHADDFAFESA